MGGMWVAIVGRRVPVSQRSLLLIVLLVKARPNKIVESGLV